MSHVLQHVRREESLGPPELCLWMLSGVLNYRLCDRDFDCEHCPLDRALRGIETAVESESAEERLSSDRARSARAAHRK
jgi:hypothetical protein